MKTNQLLVRSAVTIVATGLTMLTINQSDAHGRDPGRMGMGAGHGSMSRGAIQDIGGRAFMRTGAQTRMSGRNQIGNLSLRGGLRSSARDDRGGHGERRHGRDDGLGRTGSMTRAGRQLGDDHGRHRQPGDDKGRGNTLTHVRREAGDDHGRHHELHDDNGDPR